MDAPARQQSDALLAEEPARSLGRVARIGILGREQDERAAELVVQGGEQERQRRLRDASTRGERRGIRTETFALAELAHEWMQDGTVHDKRPNRAGSASVIVAAGG